MAFDREAVLVVAPTGDIHISPVAAGALGLPSSSRISLETLATDAGETGAVLAERIKGFFTTGAPLTVVLETDDGKLLQAVVEPDGFSARITLTDQTRELRRLREAETDATESKADADHLRLALDAIDTIVWRASPIEPGAWVEVTESGMLVDAQRRLIAAADHGGPRRVAMEASEESDTQTYSVDYLFDGPRKIGVYAHGVDPVVHTERLLNRLVHTMSETFAHLSVGLMIFDERGRLTLFNPSIIQIFDEKVEYLATRPRLGDLLDRWRRGRKLPERLDYAEWREEFLRTGETEETNREERWHMPDARTLMVLIRHHPSGGLAIVVEDITESIALRRSKAADRAVQAVITNHLNEGLAVVGPDGLVRMTNEAFRRIWGLDEAEIAREPHVAQLGEILALGDDAASFWADLRAAATNRVTGVTGERVVSLSDGRHLKARISAMPNGATLAVLTDVTASETIAAALKERNEALERADEIRKALVDQISHQMRNPLNSISGFAQILAEERAGALSDPQRKYVDGILEAAGDLTETIGEMSDLISIGADPPGGEVESFDPTHTLRDVAELALNRVGGDPSRIEVANRDNPAQFTARRVRVRQIMFNLLIDALTKAPEGAVIHSVASVENDVLTLEYRHPTTPDCASHGLALSLARRFVKLCLGELEIRTEDNSRLVRATLPAASEAEVRSRSTLAGG